MYRGVCGRRTPTPSLIPRIRTLTLTPGRALSVPRVWGAEVDADAGRQARTGSVGTGAGKIPKLWTTGSTPRATPQVSSSPRSICPLTRQEGKPFRLDGFRVEG